MDAHDVALSKGMRRSERGTSTGVCYAGALASVAAALLVRVAFAPTLDRAPYATSYLAIVFAARFCGLGPSILAALSAAFGAMLLSPPYDWMRVGLFMVLAAVIIWTVEVLHRARSDAERSAALAEERLAQLEEEARRRAQEERFSSQLRAIVESSEDAIISKDLQGVILSWNRGAEQIFGYTTEEAIGQSIKMLLPPDRAYEESDIMERIRAGGRVKHFETVRVRKDGSRIHVSITVSPMRDAAGAIIGASHIARDITERKDFEEQLRQTQKLESLGVLAGGLAHDFNNLLTGIMGNASLAMDEVDNPTLTRLRLDEVLHASERAALLIGQMLAYAGKGRFLVERLDLSAEVREILPLLQTSVSKLVRIDMQLAGDLPPVEADRAQMQQLIMNLAINAGEAIDDHPGVVTISTAAQLSDSERQVILEVRDTGVGMSEETKARIFDPFFTTKFTGRGLGLAAVMGIIRAHRGTISVTSAPGQGTTFRVALPAASGPASAARTQPESELRGEGLVLVADDEELVRNMARFTLQRFGYTVELACDGKDALDKFASQPGEYAAVLLDLTMPVMHGGEVLRAIREIRPEIPVVLSSGYTEAEAVKRFEDLRLSGFLQKPYTATVLARKLKQALDDLRKQET
jgi:two-component system CheB/CheR fusion protein